MTGHRRTIEGGATIVSAMRAGIKIQMTASSRLRDLIVVAIIFALAPRLARAASVASGPGAHAWAAPIVQPAAGSLTVDSRLELLAHLDEESVPAAENPGNPALDATAPEVNPGPSADWDRVPDDGAASSSSNTANGANSTALAPVGAPSVHSGSSTGAGTSVAAAHPEKSGAPTAAKTVAAPTGAGVHTASLTIKPAPSAPPESQVPIAPAPGMGNGPAADANNSAGEAMRGAGGEDANVGPPPALDLGSMQSGPDLGAASLDAEIKKADTPARAAALRVTEQARIDLAAGKTDDAIRDLGRAVSIDPGNPFEYFYLGRAYIARRNYAQALTFLKRAEIGFAARPDWLGATVGFEGACYEDLGQTTDAALAYRRALGTAPNNLTARVGASRMAAYLPSPASVDAAVAPVGEAGPPPEHDAAGPPPAEPPPPPPPAPLAPESAPKKIPAGDYQPD